MRIIQYGLLLLVALTTIYSIYIGGLYVITGIAGLIFIISCIFRSNSKNKSTLLNVMFVMSSLVIIASFIFDKFIK